VPGRKRIKGSHLYQILFYGVIFAVAAVGALAFWGVREIRRDAAIVAVESSARGVAGAVTVLMNAVTNSNEDIGIDALSNLDTENLRTRFRQSLLKHPVLEAILLSDANGLRYSMGRRDDGLVELLPGKDANGPSAYTLVKGDGSTEKTIPSEPFDRRAMDEGLSREFGHLKPGQVNWRSIYRFYSSGETLIAASSLMQVSGDFLMISYVFPLQAVISQLGGAERGSAEKLFLYWTSGKVLPIEADGAPVDALSASDVADPVIAGATKSLASDPDRAQKPFSYVADGERWWAYVLPLSVFGDTMSLGVAVPRKNVVSVLTSDTFIQLFGGLLVLLGGASLFVLHRNRSRIEAMGFRREAARSAEDVLHLVAEGEGSRLEFKQTLRFNLKSGKNGKEIEHASMKTVAAFMNSEGGTLLVGIADNGVISGFDEDKFETDDKALLHFNNLVNQYIGTEFARYVDTAVITVQGRSVIRAHCIPAAAPAILKSGGGEEFFVRSGPASRQLTFSQFYEWLQNH